MTTSTPSVFLSHTWSDKPFARKLASDLRAAGAEVWIDEAEIKLGDSLIEKIRSGIDAVDYLAVVLSPKSVESEWVKREVDVAMNQEIRGKLVKVLPLLYKPCALPGFLDGKLYADFTDPEAYQSSFALILDRLGLGPGAVAGTAAAIRQFSGTWRGTWEHRRQARRAVLEIRVDGGEPHAAMRITYHRGSARTIVEQELDASMQGAVLRLTGKGYRFIERGEAKGWHLDTFVLESDADLNALAGTRVDTRGREAAVRFERSPRGKEA